MTARERFLIRENFDAISDLAGPVAKLFYGRLFEIRPALRPLFPGDIGRQGTKLIDTLATVINHLEKLDSMDPVLREMGARHREYGVTEDHYELVEQALVWSLRHALGAGFGEEHRAAWLKVIGHISGVMREGARLPS